MKKFLATDKYLLWIWASMPVLNWALDFFKDRYNNFKIFKAMFWHLVHQQDLYAAYPAEHHDFFFYGPSFSLIIAPFAILPDILGSPLWGLFNALLLFYAIGKLSLKPELKIILMLLSTIELGNSIWAVQSNASMAAMIILSFTLVEEEKDFWAPLWIMLGTFAKIYGIVGLVFFLFSKNKMKFVVGCIVWSFVVFALPMLISSPNFVLQSYLDWYHVIIAKNSYLITSINSDLSVMGLVRSVSGHEDLPNTWFIVVGMLMLLLPLLRFKQYSSKHFRTLILASILMFIVLFSTAAEHSTYVICIIGLFVWMVTQPKIFTTRNNVLIFFIIMLTGLSPTFLFTKTFALFVLGYALKGLPCMVVWALLVKDLFIADFTKEKDSDYFLQTAPAAPN